MKKYIYEVGVDVQTLYVYPHANSVKEAEKLGYQMAIDEYSLNKSDYDIWTTYVQISGMTQEYKSKLNSKGHFLFPEEKEVNQNDKSDKDKTSIINHLLDIAEVDTVEELQILLEKRGDK